MFHALNLRRFRPEDQPAVRELIYEGLGDYFKQLDTSKNPDIDDIQGYFAGSSNLFVVAEMDGAVIGTGGFVSESPDVGRIVRLSVDLNYRRQRIGQQIVDRLIEHGRWSGHREVLVETNADWKGAIAFYLQVGFNILFEDNHNVHLRISI